MWSKRDKCLICGTTIPEDFELPLCTECEETAEDKIDEYYKDMKESKDDNT